MTSRPPILLIILVYFVDGSTHCHRTSEVPCTNNRDNREPQSHGASEQELPDRFYEEKDMSALLQSRTKLESKEEQEPKKAQHMVWHQTVAKDISRRQHLQSIAQEKKLNPYWLIEHQQAPPHGVIPSMYIYTAFALLCIVGFRLITDRIPLQYLRKSVPSHEEAGGTDGIQASSDSKESTHDQIVDNISRESAWENVPLLRVEQLMTNAPPGKVAVLSGSTEITYGELEQKSFALAVQVWEELSKKHDARICGLTIDKSIDMLIGILGILKAGGGYLALPPTFPDDRLQFLAGDSRAALIVSTLVFLPKVEAFAKQLPVIVLDHASKAVPSRSIETAFLEHQLAFSATDVFGIIYTSGSTGQPKGVELTHQAVSTAILQEIPQDILKQNCRVLQNFSMQFDPHISEIFGTFAAHATLVLGPKDPTDMATLHNIIQSARVDCSMFVPSIFNVYSASYGVPSMKFLAFGGEAMPIKLWSELARDANTPHVENHYGPTESSVVTTIFGPDMNLQLVAKAGSVPIGRSLRWRECLVADPDTGKTLSGYGQIGELLIGGPGLAKGYVNRPETTSEKFIQHPFRYDERVYKSGDLVQFLNSGDILFHGRADTQVKLHGLRIELGEIESVLRTCDGVVEAQVVKHDNDTLVAFLLPQTVDASIAAAVCKARLAPYMVPTTFVRLAEFPRVASGSKIDRKALMAWSLETGTSIDEEEADSAMQVSQDSMHRMRLVSKEDLHVKNLLGFAVILFCISHWKQEAFRRLSLSHQGNFALHTCYRMIRMIDTSIFASCLAYTEATSFGADGKTEAFRFTSREIYIAILWCLLIFPLPHVIQALIYIVTGQTWFRPGTNVGKIHFLYELGNHWFLLFLIVVKAFCVFAHRIGLSVAGQFLSLGIVYSIVTFFEVHWLPPVSWLNHCDNATFSGTDFDVNCAVGQDYWGYLTFVICYLVVMYFGQQFLHRCRDLFHAMIAPALRPLASVCIGAIALASFYFVGTRLHERFWGPLHTDIRNWQRLLEPVTVLSASFFAFLYVPSLQILSFIGRHALCLYIIHPYFGDVWLDGASIYGQQLFPKYETVFSKILGFFPTSSLEAQGLIAFALIAVYVFVFVATIPFLMQRFVSLFVESMIAAFQFGQGKATKWR